MALQYKYLTKTVKLRTFPGLELVHKGQRAEPLSSTWHDRLTLSDTITIHRGNADAETKGFPVELG